MSLQCVKPAARITVARGIIQVDKDQDGQDRGAECQERKWKRQTAMSQVDLEDKKSNAPK